MSKLLKAAATACVIGLGTIASASAHADRWHSGPHVGVYFGGPAFAPFYYPFYATPYYPYAADVAQPALPPLVIDGGVPTSQSALHPDPIWYFCRETGAYYPYAKTCPSPWQRVPAQPSMPAN